MFRSLVLGLLLAGAVTGGTLTHAKTGFSITPPPDWKPGKGPGLLAVASGTVTGAPDGLCVMMVSATDLEGWEERPRLAALDQEVLDEVYRQKGRVRDVDRLGPLKLGRVGVAARHVTVVRDALTGPVRGRVVQDIYTFRRDHRKFTVYFVCQQPAFARARPVISNILETLDFRAY